MIKKIAAIIIISFVLIFPQKIKLSEETKINSEILSECYFPQFSKDDSEIIFTTQNYNGLYSYNINVKETKIISDENGVGYNPILLDENNVLLRSFKIVNGRKFSSVFTKELNSGKTEFLEVDKRRISIPQQIVGTDLLLIDNSEIIKKQLSNQKLFKSTQISNAVYCEDNSLFLINDDEKIELSPLGKGVYVWESFSRDGEKIVFSFGNKGAFICDLNGNILTSIEDAHYPKFSPDGEYVLFMKDEDDGYKYISSDLYVYSLEENTEYKLTNTEDKIEMYAEWSNDGSEIVYQTPQGGIYLAKIIIEN